MEPSRKNGERSRLQEMALGFFLILGLHIVILGLFALVWAPGVTAIVAIGIIQWFYVIPAVIIAARKKRPGIVQGLLIGAGVTVLLNAACFGFVFVALR